MSCACGIATASPHLRHTACGGDVVSLAGEEHILLETPTVEAGSTVEPALPVEAVALLRSARTVAVRLAVAMTKATSWCDAGTEIAVQPLQIRDAIVDMGGAAVDLAPAGEDIIGHDVLVAGPTLSLWRALTDNDGSGQLDGRFIRSGLFRLDRVDRAVERVSPGVVRVTEWLATAFGSPVQHVRRIERLGTSDWRITERVVLADGIDDALRVGVVFELSEGFERVEWFGSGPWENYPDRARFAALGRWESSVDDLQTDYVRPQENGGRGGVVELMLRDASGTTVVTRHAKPVQFSAAHHSTADLEATSHSWLLPRRDTTFVYVDSRHRGVGTAFLGPDTNSQISGAWRIARVDVATVDQGLVVGMPVRFSARPWRSPEMTSHVSATTAPSVRTRRARPSDVRRVPTATAPRTSIRSNTASAIACRPAPEVFAHRSGSSSGSARGLAHDKRPASPY